MFSCLSKCPSKIAASFNIQTQTWEGEKEIERAHERKRGGVRRKRERELCRQIKEGVRKEKERVLRVRRREG
jgi:hypothetical protein